MGRLGQIAGLLLLIVGIGLCLWGAPYYMLDWGGTFVMAGIALASAGLSCVLLGTVVIKLARLQTDITVLRAAATVTRLEAGVAPVAGEKAETLAPAGTADDLSGGKAMTADPEPVTGMRAGGLAGVAMAGAAAGGLAVAAKSILTSVTPETDSAKTTAIAEETVEISSEVSAQATTGLTDNDRASLDDLLARLALPLSGDAAAAEPVDPPPEPAGNDAEQFAAPAAMADADDLFARIDDAAATLKLEAGADPSQEQASLTMDRDTVIAETHAPVELRSMEQRIDDEFAELRAELAVLPGGNNAEGSLLHTNTSSATAPEVDAAGQDHPTIDESALTAENAAAGQGDVADDVDDWEDRSRAAMTGANPMATDIEVAETSDEQAVQPPTNEAQRPQDMAPQPDAPEPETSTEPASSSEGVVAAYNVGDTSYAMFVDGRIRVSTPEGQFMLESMDDLKKFMAARRAPV